MGGNRGRRLGGKSKEEAIDMISRAKASGASLSSACKALDVSVRTHQRWKKTGLEDRRKGPLSEPKNKLSLTERENILSISNSKEFCDKPVSQIVPKLADRGEYVASESSFHRVLKEEKLNLHRGRAKKKSHTKPKELIATKPNEIYSWDITYLKSMVLGQFFYLYMVLDIYSRKIVGFSVHESQDSVHASELISAVYEAENLKAGEVTLHSDNGGPMKGVTMLAMLQKLGIVPSFSRPSVSNDNPYSESLFRTTKYCPQYPSKPFADIESAREWVSSFSNWYNTQHLHSGINFVTPATRHEGRDEMVLEKRRTVYEAAKLKNPERWSGKIKNFFRQSEVYLNHLQGRKEGSRTEIAA